MDGCIVYSVTRSPVRVLYITDIIYILLLYGSYLLSRSSHMNLLVTKMQAFSSTKSSPLFGTCENRSIWALLQKGGSHGSQTRFPDTIPRFCHARKTTWNTKRLRSGRCRNDSQLFNLFVSRIFGCIHQMQESRCTARLGHANAVCKSKK